MGKSGKLLKSFVAGVKVFKSPSKERHSKDDKDHGPKKRSKDKCFGSLGKSSRSCEVISAAAASPEAIEIKCVQVESEKLKDAVPGQVGEIFAENTEPAKIEGVTCNNRDFIRPGSKQQPTISDRQEELAVVKIQAAFRCYLAQRAFHALRALVRLQALARGRRVRKQAASSLRCVNALIRIQALARGRRVRISELGQLVQKHLQQTKQTRKKSSDGWVSSTAVAQQSHGKAHVKHDAMMKRHRALVYTYSEQLKRQSKKESSSLGIDSSEIDTSHWAWDWLERWTAAPKGGSAVVNSVEDCAPLVKNVGVKAKTGTKRGKHSDNFRKERRKTGEHAENSSPLSQREEQEEASALVATKEEVKVLPDLERHETHVFSEQKSVSQPSSPKKTHPPIMGVNIVGMQKGSLSDVQPSTTKMLSDVPTVSQCVTEAIQPIPSSSDSSLAGMNAIDHPSGPEISLSPDNRITSCSIAASSISPSRSNIGATNGHSVVAPNELLPMLSDSSSKNCKENLSSMSLFSHKESCISRELPSMEPLKELKMKLSMEELSAELLSRGPECDMIERAASLGTDMNDHPCNVGNAEDGSKVNLLTENIDDAQELNARQVDAENDESTNQGHASSKTNGLGVPDATMVLATAKSPNVPGKSSSGVGLNHEQTESNSPSVPSYMATTMSSKAKIRPHTSPKQKADLMKQKLESSKIKADSPKTNGGSSSYQKLDSSIKRRYSLSALDGKVSTVTQDQRPASHVRANSRANFSSVKDLSTDNFSVTNGDSRRYKQ